MSPEAERVAILGGGASGTLLALALLRLARRPLDIVIVETAPRLGRGRAFDTRHAAHLLNVAAARMSALPNEPDHFVRWLEGRGVADARTRYVPRHLYGLYLEHTLERARAEAGVGVRLFRVEGRVETLARGGRAIALRVRRRREVFQARLVALALGSPLCVGPLPQLAGDDGYLEDPWAPGALEALASDEPTLILGTGLTMVDVALAIARGGRRAPLVAISRRGLLPEPHVAIQGATLEPPPLLDLPPRVRLWLRSFRRSVSRGESWRARLDALRPLATELWERLDVCERRRFLRHLQPYWETRRHRMPPQAAEAIAELRRTGWLHIAAGRVTAAGRVGNEIEVRLVRRGARKSERLRVRRIVNATGWGTDVTRARSPLLRRLLRGGLVRPDVLRLGFDATESGALIGASGRPSQTLYTLGPGLRGILWETTAVPEIREQATALAENWLARLEDPETADRDLTSINTAPRPFSLPTQLASHILS